MLVTCSQLAARLDNPAWVVFDCRHDLMDLTKGERQYREGHIPGAHFASLETDLAGEKTGKNGRHPLPSPAAFVAFLARHAVTNTSTIVAYDDAGGPYAARLWWLARWVGLDQVMLLDGGIGKWVADGRPLSRDVPVPRAAALRGHADALMLVNADEVEARLNDGRTTLIDARAAERYRGELESIDPVAGHIPSAKNRFYKDNLNADLTFRAPEEIGAGFSTLLNSADAKKVIHQCGSGVTACANLFAMELAGLKGSKLYAGSWSEWIADPKRPIVRGTAR
jgi:thiosulfate/3-mercaptopyruvate sulfurtransferase